MTILEFPTGEGRGPLAGGAASGREPDYSDALARHAAHQTAELWRLARKLAETEAELAQARDENETLAEDNNRQAIQIHLLRIELKDLRARRRPPATPEAVAGEHTPPRRRPLIDNAAPLAIGLMIGVPLLIIATYIATPIVDQLTR